MAAITRLIDTGLERLKNIVLDMAHHSEKTVATAIDAFMEGKDVSSKIFSSSEELRMLQEEASELAIELIARYQPVASDLRFIKSCMEIAYGFSRFGRYAYDIAQVLPMLGDVSGCDKSAIVEAGERTLEMIRLSIKAFVERDVELASRLRVMDQAVDDIYSNYVRGVVRSSYSDVKCALCGTLILRYLERIADHATYIGESVLYIVSGAKVTRR
ncbi:MAG: PhoU domain-containing protein [Nitrososphaerota archaeon]